MVVCNNDRSSLILDGRIKYFSWMYQRLVECSDTDDMGIDDSASTIKGDGYKVFSVEIMILIQILIGSACICYDGILSNTLIA
jgi:hypothetical protein